MVRVCTIVFVCMLLLEELRNVANDYYTILMNCCSVTMCQLHNAALLPTTSMPPSSASSHPLQHSTIAVAVLIEMFLVYHKYPKTSTAVLILFGFCTIYIVW